MKKLISVFLLFSLLLGLCACGKQESEEATSAASITPVTQVTTTQVGDYIIPESWNEVSINDGTWGYVTAEAVAPEGVGLEYRCFVEQATDEQGNTTLVQYDLSGTELHRGTIAAMEVQEGAEQYLGYYAFGKESLWLTRNIYRIVDEETGEAESESWLENWSYEGEKLFSAPLSDYGVDDMSNFLSAMTMSPEGTPILLTQNAIVFLDEAGQQRGTMDTGGVWYDFCRDGSGRLYIADNMNTNTLYTVDYENYTLGHAVMELDGTSRILPGGGEYDLLLSNDTTLKGVSLSTGTVTEILSWEDWDLAGSVGSVTELEEGILLVSMYDLALNSSSLFTLTRVPAEEVPEKTVLRLAVPLRNDDIGYEMSWTDVMDQKVAAAMAGFNRRSSQYRIEVVTFSSATELNLLLASGDSPDMIYWNYTAWLDEPASTAMLAKKGYLVDMEPYFESDAELSLSDFIPNVVELERERNGGIYALPLSFYFTALIGDREYVGDDSTWTIQDMLAAAKQMPEDMCLWEYAIQTSVLETLLGVNLSRFVDVENIDCDFQNQDFYDLLTICRDYFPEETGEDYAPPSGGSVLTGISSMGRLGLVYTDSLKSLEQQGKTLIGYPGAEGNGLSLIFMDQVAICSMSQHQDAAWEFIRSLYSYEFQDSYSSIFISIRDDVLNDRENRYQAMYSDEISQEESQAMRDLVYGAETLRDMESPIFLIVKEEAAAYFAGDKTAEEVAEIIENRVKIYLSEQS